MLNNCSSFPWKRHVKFNKKVFTRRKCFEAQHIQFRLRVQENSNKVYNNQRTTLILSVAVESQIFCLLHYCGNACLGGK